MMDDVSRKPVGIGGVAGIDRALFELFLIHEAQLLDQRRFRDWMGLFADDGTYWVPAVPDQESPFDQASLIYDDRELMKTRIERLEHPRIHVQTPPSRTAHIVGNMIVEQANEAKGEYVVGSTLIMVEYRDDHQRVFAGRQRHRLRRDSASFRIVQKRLNLINCDSVFEAMAVPIWSARDFTMTPLWTVRLEVLPRRK
jgi:3-phenylpropionate/cinnamic acid dioxygenase small subunit